MKISKIIDNIIKFLENIFSDDTEFNLGVKSMAQFEISRKKTLEDEGFYSDRSADAGGKTMYGIKESVARKHGWKGAMRDLPLELANKIYKIDYWDFLRLSEVKDQDIANELFDTAVNCGPGFAAKALQLVLNAFNRYEQDWPDIAEDGNVGPITIRTLNKAVKKRKSNILKGLNVEQGARYNRLARNKKRKDELNINGWYANRIELPGS